MPRSAGQTFRSSLTKAIAATHIHLLDRLPVTHLPYRYKCRLCKQRFKLQRHAAEPR